MNDTMRIPEFLKNGHKSRKQTGEMLSTPLTEDITSGEASPVFAAVVTSQSSGETLLLDDVWTEETCTMSYCRIGPYLFLTIESNIFIIDPDGRLWYAPGAHVYRDDEKDGAEYDRVLEIEAVQFCTDDRTERIFYFRICE